MPILLPAFMKVLAVPPSVAGLTDIDEWRFATLAHLLAAPDLTIVSIWSPTFLIGLLDAVPALAEPLARSGARWGIWDARGSVPLARGRCRARATSDRTDERLCRASTPSARGLTAHPRFYAQRLGEMLPHAFLQPKGLLATEGAVTTPYTVSWPVPALSSAFLEFIDAAGRPLLCDELHDGETYRVVLTNPGASTATISATACAVRAIAGPLPLLEFVGRDV